MRSISSLLLLAGLTGCITPKPPPAAEPPPPVRTPQIGDTIHPRAIANRALLSLLTRAAPRGRLVLICDSTHALTQQVAQELETKLRRERGIILIDEGEPELILQVANSSNTLSCELREAGAAKAHWRYTQDLP